MNETSQNREQLVLWNENEAFPSLGIGHQIWFPQGSDFPFTEGFPLLCDYLQKHGVALPEWLDKAKHTGAPWKTRADFLQDTERVEELRALFMSTVDIQTNFMIDRFKEQHQLIIESAELDEKKKMEKHTELLRSSLLGTYALVDYINFKGTGTNPREVSKGKGWGLKQVLLDMPDDITAANAPQAFTVSASTMLLMRIRNSAPEYSLIRYLHGWMKRLSTYSNPAILDAK